MNKVTSLDEYTEDTKRKRTSSITSLWLWGWFTPSHLLSPPRRVSNVYNTTFPRKLQCEPYLYSTSVQNLATISWGLSWWTLWVCVCVFVYTWMHVCVCVVFKSVYVHTGMLGCRGQRTTSSSVFRSCHLFFSPVGWEFLTRLGWLASKPQGFLSLSQCCIISTCHYAGFTM